MSNKKPNLTMAQKLKMFREMNNLSQEELGEKLSVSGKTISAWENGEREINLNNSKAICELFDYPTSYFVFDENYKQLTSDQRDAIEEYVNKCELAKKIEKVISTCKMKLESDGLPLKKEYLPVFDYDKNNFSSCGIFEKDSLPVKPANRTGIGIIDFFLDTKFDDDKLDDIKSIRYSSSMLIKYNLNDILQRYNQDVVELKDLTYCNDLEIIKTTLSNMQNRQYNKEILNYKTNIDISQKYLQEQLNDLLENLSPNLTKFWEIIVYLIDNGAFYEKPFDFSGTKEIFRKSKDVSKTNLVYKFAKDTIKNN